MKDTSWDRVVREKELREFFLGDISHSTLYRWMAAGIFPRPHRFGPRVVGWYASEIRNWQPRAGAPLKVNRDSLR